MNSLVHSAPWAAALVLLLTGVSLAQPTWASDLGLDWWNVPALTAARDAAAQNMTRLDRNYEIVQRRSYNESPPRVEYELTDEGRALLPIIEEMRRFGHAWILCDHDHEHEHEHERRMTTVIPRRADAEGPHKRGNSLLSSRPISRCVASDLRESDSDAIDR